jgi:hypothetical protein
MMDFLKITLSFLDSLEYLRANFLYNEIAMQKFRLSTDENIMAYSI